MSNVIPFSNKVLTRELDKRVEDLKELYRAMKLCYDTIETLEERIQAQEAEYDEHFAKYVHKVGIDNIQIGYAEYVSGDLAVDLSTGEIHYISKEEEPEKE